MADQMVHNRFRVVPAGGYDTLLHGTAGCGRPSLEYWRKRRFDSDLFHNRDAYARTCQRRTPEINLLSQLTAGKDRPPG